MKTTKTMKYTPLSLGLCLLLTACAQPMVRDTNIKDEMQSSFELSADAATALPKDVSASLLPPMQLQLPGIHDIQTETRFDVKVRRVRARDFFLSLVDGTPYNMVVHPKLGGYISLDLKNTTVPEVLKVVRSVHGYDFKMTGKTIQVFPNTIHTRIFKVDYLAMKRTGASVTTSKTGQISVSGSSADNGSDSNSGSSNSSTIQTDSSSDFWNELKVSLEMLVGQEDGRRVSINAQTGMVVVRAEPSILRVVEEYLETSQAILTRQVILEARILEVTLNDRFQTGINWSVLNSSDQGMLSLNQVGGGSIFSGNGYTSHTGSSVTLDPGTITGIAGSVTDSFGGVFGAALSTRNFDAFIELLKAQGDVQVLSSPRVSTINNQKAVIKVGNDEFFVTNVETDENNNVSGGTTSVSVELEPFFSGVALDVIPQISEDGEIVLHVHPAVSDVNEQTKTVSTTFGSLILPLAASNIRESDTIIRASNGQVVVIGGLMQNITTDDQAGIPVLGDIPVLGHLFRHTKQETRKSELVILLKPTIVDAEGRVWQREMQRSSDTIKALN